MEVYAKLNAVALAKYILTKLGDMSHLKLQKLIYYIEAWHLAVIETSIIDDNFEAWVHGPVCPNVWRHFRDEAVLNGFVTVIENEKSEATAAVESLLSESQLQLTHDVLEEYGKQTAYHLECLTHEERPWIEAREGIPPAQSSNVVISKATMQSFYCERLTVV